MCYMHSAEPDGLRCVSEQTLGGRPIIAYHSLQSESMARAKVGINAPLTQF